jgi:hypothetical protein
MATVPEKRTRVKPSRTVRLLLAPSADNPAAIIAITMGKRQDYYQVKGIPSDWGNAFELTKLHQPEPVVYFCNLDRQGQLCTGIGFEKWGHCKHVASLCELLEAGQLQAATAWATEYGAWSDTVDAAAPPPEPHDLPF